MLSCSKVTVQPRLKIMHSKNWNTWKQASYIFPRKKIKVSFKIYYWILKFPNITFYRGKTKSSLFFLKKRFKNKIDIYLSNFNFFICLKEIRYLIVSKNSVILNKLALKSPNQYLISFDKINFKIALLPLMLENWVLSLTKKNFNRKKGWKRRSFFKPQQLVRKNTRWHSLSYLKKIPYKKLKTSYKSNLKLNLLKSTNKVKFVFDILSWTLVVL